MLHLIWFGSDFEHKCFFYFFLKCKSSGVRLKCFKQKCNHNPAKHVKLQVAFTCSNSTIETLEQVVKCVVLISSMSTLNISYTCYSVSIVNFELAVDDWDWAFCKKLNFRCLTGFNNSLHKKLSFPLKISLVNVTKSAGNCGFELRIWSYLPKKSLMENVIFCAMITSYPDPIIYQTGIGDFFTPLLGSKECSETFLIS